jgi:predicted HAD superfamily Cof-like phosphohydrolase
MTNNEKPRAERPGISKEYLDVRAFHEKFGQLVFDTPGFLSGEKLAERIDFMAEELSEFIQASGFEPPEGAFGKPRHNPEAQDIDLMADSLIDLVYVAIGTAIMMGLPWDDLWDDVQRANMAKVPGVTHRGTQKDVCKPPGWQGPVTGIVLARHGYERTDWFGEDLVFNKEKARDDVER